MEGKKKKNILMSIYDFFNSVKLFNSSSACAFVGQYKTQNPDIIAIEEELLSSGVPSAVEDKRALRGDIKKISNDLSSALKEYKKEHASH